MAQPMSHNRSPSSLNAKSPTRISAHEALGFKLSLALPVRMLVVLRLFRRCRRAIRLPIVLVVVDRFARVVLLMVHLLTPLRREAAPVGLPVVAYPFISG